MRTFQMLLMMTVTAVAATGTAVAQVIEIDEESISVVPEYRCKNQYTSPHCANWFIQFGAGINHPLVENELTDGDAKARTTANFNVGMGRWFSPYIGFRLGGNYGKLQWNNVSSSSAHMVNANFDVMWDAFNSLMGVNATRVVSLVPFVGVGGTYVWDIASDGSNIYDDGNNVKTTSWTFPMSAGMQLRFRLCPYADMFFEGRAAFYGDNFNGAAYGHPIDINIQAVGGFAVTIGGVKFNTYNACKDLNTINMLNNRVNDLRAEVAATAAALAIAQSQLPCPEVETGGALEIPTESTSVLMATVRFSLNSAVITPEEMVNVFNVAQFLNENPSVGVDIKGYADKATGTAAYNLKLSKQRAQAVFDALTQRYGIAANRLSVEGEGSAVQPYSENNWNRIVIFVPME